MKQTEVECLIANAGSLPLDALHEGLPGLKQIIWVVERTSQHMDWAGTPDGAQGRLTVSVWHDLVAENKEVGPDMPIDNHEPGNLVQIWPSKTGPAEVTEFTQKVDDT